MHPLSPEVVLPPTWPLLFANGGASGPWILWPRHPSESSSRGGHKHPPARGPLTTAQLGTASLQMQTFVSPIGRVPTEPDQTPMAATVAGRGQCQAAEPKAPGLWLL